VSGRLVVLDIGSTLVRASPGHPATRIARRLGLDADRRAALNEALMTSSFASPAEAAAAVRELLGAADPELERVVHEVWSAQETEAEPVTGAQEALAALAAHGFRLALVSNIWQPYLSSVERHFGTFFAEHIPPPLQLFSFRQGRMKPAPDLFERALRAAGLPAADAVMVGDGYVVDIEPAIALGMKTIWILERPDREAANLARVLNAAAPRPSLAATSVAELDPQLVSSLWDGARTQPSSHEVALGTR
jgi:HAD superfamily hydrolase (TIGR01509 family)